MDADDLLEAKIYVGTYRKYNEGSLYGKWLTLSDYSDKEEFYEACKELHKDEEDPEFMFQDWEGLPKGLISESWISETVFELIEQADQMDNFDAFMAFLDYSSYSLEDEDFGYLLSKFNDCYQGKFDTEESFAEDFVENNYELPCFAQGYFDYEKFANTLFMTDYYFDDGTRSVFNRNY